jgi:hypothetical protein
MRRLIVPLRIIGLISFVALFFLYKPVVRKISVPYEIAYWSCIGSFGSALLIQLLTSSFFPRLFSTSFFGYLKREEELEVE